MKELSFISILFCFAFSLSSQPQWSYDVTDKSHNILFPSEVGDEYFESGDYIGVFYEEADDLYCSGYSVFTTGENLVITAFGESFSFSGFSEGDYFRFIHFSNNIETEFYVNYNTTDFPNTASFAIDGLSGVISIVDNPILGCTDVGASNYNLTATVDDNSCISFEQLEIDSLNQVIISNQLQYNSSIQYLDDSLSLIINQNQEYYSNSVSIFTQTIADFNVGIDLPSGWNMFGYGCPSPIDIAECLSNHTESIIIAKDNFGNVYMPEFGFNGIGDFTPGYGYQIKLTDAIDGLSLCDWYITNFLGE